MDHGAESPRVNSVAYPPGEGGISVTVSPTSMTVIYRPFDFGLIHSSFFLRKHECFLSHPLDSSSNQSSI